MTDTGPRLRPCARIRANGGRICWLAIADKQGEEPATADEAGLRRFLEGEVSLVRDPQNELFNRPLIREQAFGEALDPYKLERLAVTRSISTASSNGRWLIEDMSVRGFKAPVERRSEAGDCRGIRPSGILWGCGCAAVRDLDRSSVYMAPTGSWVAGAFPFIGAWLHAGGGRAGG